VNEMTLALFGLLTRIRLTRNELDLATAASRQHMFPIVGLVIGLVASLMALVLDYALGQSNSIVSGAALITLLYAVTGIMHTEGLADFADGIMAHGTPQRKREVMKDPHVGVAAVIATVIFVILLFALATRVCASAGRDLDAWPLPWAVPFALGLVVSEVGGKLAMNTAMTLGPSSHDGMGSLFVQGASRGRFLAACGIAAVTCFFITGWFSAIVFTGVLAGVAVTAIARRNVGGVSGDVFGAANEIGRIATLMMWVVLA
jgi:adenosylcobinamide-GDP ribazoletransferase